MLEAVAGSAPMRRRTNGVSAPRTWAAMNQGNALATKAWRLAATSLRPYQATRPAKGSAIRTM